MVEVQLANFFHKYAIHFTTDGFPVLTWNRRNNKTTDHEIIMLGDSHGWGQGASGFDGLRAYFSSHMAYPYSKGFFAKVKEHLEQSKQMRAESVIPMLSEEVLRVSGMFHQADVPVVQPVAAPGFYSAKTRHDSSFAHMGYLAMDHKFGDELCIVEAECKSDGTCEAEWSYEMTGHASKVYIGLITGKHGAKMDITLRTAPYYVRPAGYPRVYRIVDGEQVEWDASKVRMASSGSILIDTYDPTGDSEQVLCIDYGQKQKGQFVFRCVASPDQANLDQAEADKHEPESYLNPSRKPVLMLRGIVFNGNHVRNFSMGGHTVGQWLGDGTKSFNDDSHPHIDEILNFVPFTPTLALIQAPIVNEYLRQTPMNMLLMNLETLIGKLNAHHNTEGTRKMDVLMFSTLGDRRIQFEEAASLPLTYADYFQSVKTYCLEKGYGFIDFQQYFSDLVDEGLLDYELLFDDAIHPSSFANECIAQGLCAALDMLM